MLLLALLATAVSARVFDSLPAVPKGWREVRPAKPTDPITLKVALKQQHPEALEQAVIEISTPGHPNYGLHMSKEELRSYTAPAARSVSEVSSWLAEFGIQQQDVDNDWITISTTVQAANELLDAKFAWYEYEEDGGPKLRTLSYSVPDDVADHVDLVQPTTRFGQLGAKRSTIFDMTIVDEDANTSSVASVDDVKAKVNVDAAVCGATITPDCLKSLYNISYVPKENGNLVAFASYLEEYARYSDLQTFETNYVPSAKGQNFSVTLVHGGLNEQTSSDDSGEANLDVQYVLGISHPIPIVEYSTGGRGPLVPTRDQPTQPGSNEPYLDFLQYIVAQPDTALPQTLTTSYGEEEQSVPQEYALKVCNLFMQLGARGVSVLFSSGDSGPGNSCVRNTDNATFFNPTFPAGCPYVTAVGATSGTGPERAVSFSSGGFSIYHAQPAWQQAAVAGYLQQIGSTYAPYFNASGRGIPDVAAQGSAFAVIDKGRTARLSGTSASSPVFAGVVALLNAARKSKGQAPLGFLNPWLYNNSAALTDITAGASVGCTGNRAFLSSGARFNATAGWDPVTGLGTPKFDQLLAIAAPGVPNKRSCIERHQ
ncbi:hypothetical protein DL546_004244 [Coniochaeta pulveracea]|uniref:tripeptidyl-peptidase II n=1 Tax=Coniochaeta pulveracea TaxID=177199 RepID=A0A420XZM9_9PEZI|nr:hypothetical protein DL546_004244 [Coniochaeta pulveracea]